MKLRRCLVTTVALLWTAAAQAQQPDARHAFVPEQTEACPAAAEGSLVDIAARHYEASRAVEGSIAAMARFAPQLLSCSPEPLSIVALGGSITAGTHIMRPSHQSDGVADPSCELLRTSACDSGEETVGPAEACIGLAWPAVLERRLNEEYPCANGEQHRVHSHPKPGDGSPYHIQRLRDCMAVRAGTIPEVALRHKLRTQGTCVDLASTHVVIVDTAINDEEDTTAAETEHLIRLLRLLPRKPALYWLGTSFSHTWVPPPRLSFSEDKVYREQAKALEYYGVPQVSVLGAMQEDIATEEGRRAWAPFFGSDDKHPTAWGSAALAEFMFHNLQRDVRLGEKAQQAKVAAPGQGGLVKVEDDPFPPLKFSHEEEGTYNYVEADLTDADVVVKVAMRNSGFVLREDVPGKPGLIGMDVGDVVLLQPLHAQRVRGGCQFAISYLISYEHMGIMLASVFHEPPTADPHARYGAGVACDARAVNMTAAPVHSQWIDTAIIPGQRNENSKGNDRISVARSRELTYVLPPGVECAWLRVKIMPYAQPRTENKVKLLRFTTKCPARPVEQVQKRKIKMLRARQVNHHG